MTAVETLTPDLPPSTEMPGSVPLATTPTITTPTTTPPTTTTTSTTTTTTPVAKSDWEVSVPIYFEVSTKNNPKLVSSPFYFAQPEDIEKKLLKLLVQIDNEFIYITDEVKVNTILALSSIEKGLIYPPRGLETKEYYSKIEILLQNLKKHLNNDDLVLKR